MNIHLQLFELWPFLKVAHFQKKVWAVVHAFFQKMAPKSPKIFITFSDTH